MGHVSVMVPDGHTVQIHPPGHNPQSPMPLHGGMQPVAPGQTGMINDPMAAGAKAAMDAALPTPNEKPIKGKQPAPHDGKASAAEQPKRTKKTDVKAKPKKN